MLLPLKNKPIQQPTLIKPQPFWQHQPASLKFPYLVLLLVSIAALGLGIYHYFTGENTFIQWVRVPALQPVDAFIDQFSQGGHTFNIKANGYLLTERFDASLPNINVSAAYLFLGLIGLSLIFFLTAASTLKRWPFLVAMLLLMFFLVTANLGGLGLFPFAPAYIMLPVMLGLALPAYAFQAFFPHVSFSRRLAVFTGLVAILSWFVFASSNYNADVTTLHLIGHAAPALLVASVLFIIWVAIENLHFLVWINTQAREPERRFGVWQFMLISFLYLANLAMPFLKDAGVWDLGINYLNAFLILIFSTAAGFWGLRKREQIYGNILLFWPGAAFLFLVFATVTFSTIGYAFATANDPMIAGFNSIIIYTHLAYGILFFLYVMINFGRLIGQKLQVHKVIYDPKNLPFFTVYLMGTLAAVGLFVKTNALAYSQIKAGNFNYLGDLYNVSGEELLAERYYQESSIFEHYNVKANYSLAGISRRKHFRSTEIVYLKEALTKRPNEKVYARFASVFDNPEYFFEQQFALKEGLAKFPESLELNNNMALLFNKTALADSVFHYYNQAENADAKNEVIQSNKLAFFIKNALPEEAKKLAEENKGSNYVPFKSNAVLLQHLTGQKTEKPTWPAKETTFTPAGFSLLYHTVLNRLQTSDTTAINRLNTYAQVPANGTYAEDFLLLKGALEHFQNKPLAAKETYENLSRSSSSGTGYYQDILGQHMLKFGLYDAAVEYFSKARSNNFPDSGLHEVYALALAGKKTEALEAAKSLQTAENPETVKEAQHLLPVLEATETQALALSDAQKVQFLQFASPSDKTDPTSILNSIKDPELLVEARLAQISNYLKRNELLNAGDLLSNLKPSENESLLQTQSRLYCQFWAKSKDIKALERVISKLNFAPHFEPEKIYYKALIAVQNKKTSEAKTLFNKVEKVLPYHEEAMIAAANFYRDTVKDDMRAYNILMTGITYNPFSSSLYKAYVLQSLRTGFESYAQAGMEQLQTLISGEEYSTFNRLYQAELSKIKEVTAGWE